MAAVDFDGLLDGSQAVQDQRICRQCGNLFAKGTYGAGSKICSHKCRGERAAWTPRRRACAHCHTDFHSESCLHRFCSERCEESGETPGRTACDLLISAVCRGCRRIFQPSSRGGNTPGQRVFCTKECRLSFFSRLGRQTRSNRLDGVTREPVDWLAVMRRDRWTCHICHRKTPQHLRGTTDPLAPEVDHIIPTAAGGDDTYDNVACACRECNIKKKAQIKGQLSLFVTVGNRKPITNQMNAARKRKARDAKILAAIEVLLLFGQRPTLYAISIMTRIKRETIRAAARRDKPEWISEVAPYQPTPNGQSRSRRQRPITRFRRINGKPVWEVVAADLSRSPPIRDLSPMQRNLFAGGDSVGRNKIPER